MAYLGLPMAKEVGLSCYHLHCAGSRVIAHRAQDRIGQSQPAAQLTLKQAHVAASPLLRGLWNLAEKHQGSQRWLNQHWPGFPLGRLC